MLDNKELLNNLLDDSELEDVTGGFGPSVASKAMHACGNGQRGQLRSLPLAQTHGKQQYECTRCHKKGTIYALHGEPGLCDLR